MGEFSRPITVGTEVKPTQPSVTFDNQLKITLILCQLSQGEFISQLSHVQCLDVVSQKNVKQETRKTQDEVILMTSQK